MKQTTPLHWSQTLDALAPAHAAYLVSVVEAMAEENRRGGLTRRDAFVCRMRIDGHTFAAIGREIGRSGEVARVIWRQAMIDALEEGTGCYGWTSTTKTSFVRRCANDRLRSTIGAIAQTVSVPECIRTEVTVATERARLLLRWLPRFTSEQLDRIRLCARHADTREAARDELSERRWAATRT